MLVLKTVDKDVSTTQLDLHLLRHSATEISSECSEQLINITVIKTRNLPKIAHRRHPSQQKMQQGRPKSNIYLAAPKTPRTDQRL